MRHDHGDHGFVCRCVAVDLFQLFLEPVGVDSWGFAFFASQFGLLQVEEVGRCLDDRVESGEHVF